MLFRLFLLALLLVLLFRVIRKILAGLLLRRRLRSNRAGDDRGKPPLELDESQIQDAEFHDIDT
jgi:hypothetical protein